MITTVEGDEIDQEIDMIGIEKGLQIGAGDEVGIATIGKGETTPVTECEAAARTILTRGRAAEEMEPMVSLRARQTASDQMRYVSMGCL